MHQYYYMVRFEEDFRKIADDAWRTANPKETYMYERKTREGWHKMRQEFLVKNMRYILRVTL